MSRQLVARECRTPVSLTRTSTVVAERARRDGERAPLAHRLAGVHAQVHEHLVDLVGMALDARQLAVAPLDGDAALGQVRDQHQRRLEALVQVDRLDVGLVEARERAQRAHDVAHARAGQPRHLRQILDGAPDRAPRCVPSAHAREDAQEEIVVVHHGGQRRVDLVRHAGDELAERRHLGVLHQAPLGRAQLAERSGADRRRAGGDRRGCAPR